MKIKKIIKLFKSYIRFFSLFSYIPHVDNSVVNNYELNLITLGNKNASFTIASAVLKNKSYQTIYSFGVGEDVSFDLCLLDYIDKYKLGSGKVYAFDPTPKSINWAKKNISDSRIQFFPYGISNIDGQALFYEPQNPDYVSGSLKNRKDLKTNPITVEMKTLSTIMKELNHDHIDFRAYA